MRVDWQFRSPADPRRPSVRAPPAALLVRSNTQGPAGRLSAVAASLFEPPPFHVSRRSLLCCDGSLHISRQYGQLWRVQFRQPRPGYIDYISVVHWRPVEVARKQILVSSYFVLAIKILFAVLCCITPWHQSQTQPFKYMLLFSSLSGYL